MNISIERGKPMGRKAFWCWYALAAVLAGLIGLFAANNAMDAAERKANCDVHGICGEPQPVYLVDR